MDVKALQLAGLRILVVEDEYLLASQLADDLRLMGADPLGPVPTVKGALQLITDTSRLDTAILNVRLRGELSFPVADELLRRGIPFVFVTGSEDDVRHYKMPTFQKPAEMRDVANSLRSLVQARTPHEVVAVLPQSWRGLRAAVRSVRIIFGRSKPIGTAWLSAEPLTTSTFN